jgi:hypothetical protein
MFNRLTKATIEKVTAHTKRIKVRLDRKQMELPLDGEGS